MDQTVQSEENSQLIETIRCFNEKQYAVFNRTKSYQKETVSEEAVFCMSTRLLIVRLFYAVP